MTNQTDARELLSVPSEVYTRQYYLTEAAGWDKFLVSGGLDLRYRDRRVLSLADIQADQHILDIGCGRGEMLAQFMRLGATAVGLDYSEDAVMLSSETIRRAEDCNLPGRTIVVRANGKHLPLPDGSFDRVVLVDVVEHLHPWELARCLREVYRVLKPDGAVVVHTTPNRWYANLGYGVEGLLFRLIHLSSLSGLTWKLPRNDYHRQMHVNELSPVSLHKSLVKAGFKVRLVFFPVRQGGSGVKQLGRRLLQCTRPFAYLFSSELYAYGWKYDRQTTRQ